MKSKEPLNRNQMMFRYGTMVFVAIVLLFTIDIFKNSTLPGKKKWGVEAIKEGREEIKSRSKFKHKIERKLNPDTLSTK